jgi:cytochrome c peroxidase
MLPLNFISANCFKQVRYPLVMPCLFAALWVCLVAAEVSGAETAQALPSDHRVGLADSRVGYESQAYVTDSKGVIVSLGQRQSLHRLSETPPLGLPQLASPLQAGEINLGRQLFFDRRLSVNETLSCAMCHIPEQGFTQNELATPVGHLGKGVRRNVPSLYNVAYTGVLFLDGRETSLEDQIWSPLLAVNEMANPSREAVLKKLASNADYRAQFNALYPAGLTEESVGRALAAYQRALLSGDSPFDRWYFVDQMTTGTGDPRVSGKPYPPLAEEGFAVFQKKGCASCHRLNESNALFTDSQFHNTGTGFRRYGRALRPPKVQLAPGVYIVPTVDAETETFTDEGRFEVTGNPADRWRYRTPSLRNVALTAPYMHDGSLATLESVVKFYADGGGGDPMQDPRTSHLRLSQQEQSALVAFLRTLTSDHVDALVSDARSVVIGERSAGGQ